MALGSRSIVDQKNNFMFCALISFVTERASPNEHNMMQRPDCIHWHVKPILPPVQNHFAAAGPIWPQLYRVAFSRC